MDSIVKTSLKLFTLNLLCISAYSAPLPVPEIDIGTIDPARIGRDITAKPIPILSTDKELEIPVLSQSVDLGDAKKYKFKLKKVNFTDNTVISSAELEEDYSPYYNKTIDLAKLLELVNITTLKYRDAGYVLSQAYLPAQDIDKEVGIIQVSILEGYVNEVTVSGDSMPYSTKILLKQYGERMSQERPITKATLERYALLSQDIQGASVKVVFSPAPNQAGGANAEFIVDDGHLLGVSTTVDNRGTRLLGPLELSGTVDQYNIFYGNHTVGNIVRDDHKELRVYNFSHTQPLNSDGLAASFQYIRTLSNPNYKDLPTPIYDVETPGKGHNYTAQLSYPLIRARTHNLMSQIKYDISEGITWSRDPSLTLFNERLHMARVGLTFDWLDSVFFDMLGLTSIGVEYTRGLPTRGAFLREDVATRPNLKKNFQKVTGNLTRQQPFWDSFEFKLMANGQYAYDNLSSSEEYGYGGKDMGLGYDSYEISGEHGIAAKAELSYTVPTAKLLPSNLSVLNLQTDIFAFYDAGKVWNKHSAVSGQNKQDVAKSTGFGIRGSLYDYFTYEAYYAKPLARDLQNTLDTSSRVFFLVGFAYPAG